MIVVLPEPVGPTMATFLPAGIFNEIFFNICLLSSYPKLTSLNSTSPLGASRSNAFALSAGSGSSSMISNTRSAPATAVCRLLYTFAISTKGLVNCLEYKRNVLISPMSVILPLTNKRPLITAIAR